MGLVIVLATCTRFCVCVCVAGTQHCSSGLPTYLLLLLLLQRTLELPASFCLADLSPPHDTQSLFFFYLLACECSTCTVYFLDGLFAAIRRSVSPFPVLIASSDCPLNSRSRLSAAAHHHAYAVLVRVRLGCVWWVVVRILAATAVRSINYHK